MIKYFEDGKIKFEGEYLNGEANGKGKIYNENGKLEFEVEFVNGKANIKGKDNMKMEN